MADIAAAHQYAEACAEAMALIHEEMPASRTYMLMLFGLVQAIAVTRNGKFVSACVPRAGGYFGLGGS